MIRSEAYLKEGNRHILYDPQFPVKAEWFDPAVLPRVAQLCGESEGGRNKAIFFKVDGQEYMLKHYRRGGAATRWLKDLYLYTGNRRVRAFQEWRLLHQMQRWQLPTPVPCAASYLPKSMFYVADIILKSCRPAKPIASLLRKRSIEKRHWRLIGQTLRHFHNKNVFHADLNAYNILLLPEKNHVVLVDFDRSFINTAHTAWRRANLKRLARSLAKLHAAYKDNFHYNADEFSALVDAYYNDKPTLKADLS